MAYVPRGFRFFDSKGRNFMLRLWGENDLWLFKRYPDGHWVSQRPATNADLDALNSAGYIVRRRGEVHGLEVAETP